VSGNNQTGTIGAQLPAPLTVALTDPANHPILNQDVVFKVTGNDGTVSSSGSGGSSAAVAVNTDSNGRAQAFWTLGQRSGAGINNVQVSSPLAVSPVNFTATGVTANASAIVVDSGNDQTGVLSQPLPFPFVVAVVDSGHNRVPNVSVTFTVKKGDGNLGGSSSQTIQTDSNGRAIAVLTLGTQAGNANNVVEATFANNPGFPAAFAASARAPGNPANTAISGIVLDNSNNPIPGATIRLFATNQGNSNNLPVQVGTPVQTDAKGTFLIQAAPVGSFKLMADGTTASGSNRYPTLEYDIVTVAGNNNTLGMPIYLPALDTVNKRRPHLVTFEDPVEVFYYDDPETAAKWGLDVTPRQKGIDAGSLSEALQDCLRQTPDLVYIGETRELRDWKRLVDFAGTGHLIVTTCHAGSLTEVVSTLCKAVDATTAARRSALASRLVAIAHLRRATVDIANKPGGDQAIFRKDAMLPALLRRTASGINAFTGNGLAALLPESACKDEVRRHCYGRSYFARKLVCMPDLKNREKNQLENYQDRLTKLAIQYDLEGLSSDHYVLAFQASTAFWDTLPETLRQADPGLKFRTRSGLNVQMMQQQAFA